MGEHKGSEVSDQSNCCWEGRYGRSWIRGEKIHDILRCQLKNCVTLYKMKQTHCLFLKIPSIMGGHERLKVLDQLKGGQEGRNG